MAYSTVCQSKWKPIAEPWPAKPKTYRQAPTNWLKFYHYENTPIQIYWKFHLQKNEIFQVKISDTFHISAQNVDCGYSFEPPRRGGSNEYHNLCFEQK